MPSGSPVVNLLSLGLYASWINMPLWQAAAVGDIATSVSQLSELPTLPFVCCLLAHCVFQVLDPVIEHMLQLVASNDERLADYGSDRTYNIFRCLVNINLPRMIQYCVPAEEKAERYAKVRAGLGC
jgi:hypothetical protein